MKPFDFFDDIYCINLPHSFDRRVKMTEEFNKMGILNRVEWIYAKPPPKNFRTTNFRYMGELGVGLSQIKCMIRSIGRNSNNCLIFEDDVTFDDNILQRMQNGINQLPKNWNALYLGGQPRENMKDYSSELSSVGFVLGAYGYSVSRPFMMELVEKYLDEFTLDFPNCTVDDIIGRSVRNNNSYTFDPPVCHPYAGQSVIRNAHRDYEKFINNLWNIHSPKK